VPSARLQAFGPVERQGLGIAILGQLYVAMLIGLILGRFHQTMRR
jgi:hypothetical protein